MLLPVLFVDIPRRYRTDSITQASGRIGGAFVEALLKTKEHIVTALRHPTSKGELPHGVHSVAVDYDDEASLVKALEGQQFLVITLSASAPSDLHSRLTSAAAKAGVPYVMPNIYSKPLRTVITFIG